MTKRIEYIIDEILDQYMQILHFVLVLSDSVK